MNKYRIYFLLGVMTFNLVDYNIIYIYIYRLSSSSFGVHPLRMTTSSSSTLKVGFAVAEEANV